MYSLYQSYGIIPSKISNLFLSGFLSAAFFGTFIGSFIDHYGRRNACLVYCVLEVIINTLEHSSNYQLLVLGRVLGGISTSILFSAFESWMVTEHKRRKFSDDLLSETFSKASIGNGLLAILAGVISHFVSDYMGLIGPFQLAIAITFIAFYYIHQWDENFGAVSKDSTDWKICINQDREVWLLGLGSSFFEGAMYVFVFMWVPTLQELSGSQDISTGLIFSDLMLCVAFGGCLFSFIQHRMSSELIAGAAATVGLLSMLVPGMTRGSFWSILIVFMLFEITVGVYAPCSASLRSKYISADHMGAVLSFYRLPLNLIVTIGTKLGDFGTRTEVFYFASFGLLVSAYCHWTLYKETKQKKAKVSKSS